jgi:hypothetical protein
MLGDTVVCLTPGMGLGPDDSWQRVARVKSVLNDQCG